MRSVKQALEVVAHEYETSIDEILQLRMADHLDGSLPVRYQRLALDVFLRLPEGWDSHAHWEMVAGSIEDPCDKYLAGARLLESEDDALQRWEVRIEGADWVSSRSSLMAWASRTIWMHRAARWVSTSQRQCSRK